jgi:hypothetical protein
VIASSVERIKRQVADDASVLDVGGWGKPFVRADVVIDQMPYETRGLYGFDGDGPQRFDAASWVQRDMCDREPWPFADRQFDFAICSQTLEDLRDPVWVCSELIRVAKAGYIEVPSRLEEQTLGVQGPWVGWGHHHWLVDVTPAGMEFVFKHHVMHGNPRAHFPSGFVAHLADDERVQQLWWSDSFEYRERTFVDAPGLDGYLESYVATELAWRGLSPPGADAPAWRRRIAAARRRLNDSLPRP